MRNTVISISFFLSGAAALMYEILWTRMLALTFGNTVYAVGVVLTAFMSGLSLGGFLLGRWADKKKNPLKWYGVFELCIAASALFSPIMLKFVESAYHSISPISMSSMELLGARYILSAVVLLLPTTFMGGTLPLLGRHFVRSDEETEKRIGALYSINTLGGILGTFLAGFIMIRFLGMTSTLGVAVAINASAGIVSLYLGTKHRALDGYGAEAPEPEGSHLRYALCAFALASFSSMAYQVAWTRLLISVIGSATYSFSLILMGVLSGIALGSMAVSFISRRIRLGLVHFSLLEMAIGLIGLGTIAFFGLFPSLVLHGLQLGESYPLILAVEFILILLYIAVPTTLMGAAFPIVAAAYNDNVSDVGKSVGDVYGSNTLGAALGSSLSAFLLLPVFGTVAVIKIAAFINILVGLSALLAAGRKRAFVAASVLLLLPFAPIGIPAHLLHTGVGVYGKHKDYSIKPADRFDLFVKEGANATIAVSAFYDGFLNLSTNGKTDASTEEDMSTQLAMGYFPVLLHPNPKDVLVVGFGSGVTVRAVLDFPEVAEVECVEIEPAVYDAAGYFESVNNGVYQNPRAQYFVDDARSHITASDKHYDVIISEPSNPWISGIGNLFSKDFYEIASSKLAKDGIFAQWIQLYSLSPENLKMILRTFNSVFKNSTVWQPSRTDIIVIGYKGAGRRLDYGLMAEKLDGPAMWDLNAYLNVSGPMDVFSYYVTGQEGIASISRGADINTDDKPLLEFNAPISRRNASNAANQDMLMDTLVMPEIEGLSDSGSAMAKFLYRKTVNYEHLGIPARKSWMEHALVAYPDDARYASQRAMDIASEGMRDAAFAILDVALKNSPKEPDVYFYKGMLLKDTDPVAAADYIDHAASLREDDFHYQYEAAQSHLGLEEYEKAYAHFQRSKALPHKLSEESRLFAFMGYTLLKMDDITGAVEHFGKAVDANPYNFQFMMQLAGLYHDIGFSSGECGLYERIIRLPVKEASEEAERKRDSFCNPVQSGNRQDAEILSAAPMPQLPLGPML